MMEREKAVERSMQTGYVEIFRGRKTKAIGVELCESLGQQHCAIGLLRLPEVDIGPVENAKQDGCCRDAERECQNRRPGKSRALAKLAKGISEILKQLGRLHNLLSYSYRSATMGSTLAALRARISAASNPTDA